MLQPRRPLHLAFEFLAIFFVADVVRTKIIKSLFIIAFSKRSLGKV